MSFSHHHRHHHHHHRQQSDDALASSQDRATRRQLYRRAAVIMPAFFFVLGVTLWTIFAAVDESQGISSHTRIIGLAKFFTLFGGGILAIFLICEWIRKFRAFLRNEKKRKENELFENRHHHHHHHHSHHHHHTDQTEKGDFEE